MTTSVNAWGQFLSRYSGMNLGVLYPPARQGHALQAREAKLETTAACGAGR